MAMLRNDIRYALRLMRRNPGFTAVAVLSLALGIGANTAIYSLFYTIMLCPLPVSHPEQLVQLVRDTPDEQHWPGYWAWNQYELFRDHNHVFTGVTGMGFDNLASVRVDGSDPDTLVLESIPGNYFAVLGIKPVIGRLPGAADIPADGDGNVVAVSWSYWNSRFHRDPSILGKQILYNERPKTIIGVVPRSYVGPRVGARTDLWLPANQFGLFMLARLQPGVPLLQAQAEINVLYHRLVEPSAPHPKGKGRMELLPAGAGLVRVQDQYRKPFTLLLSVVGLLLLLACINMASMLLARSAVRQRELAVRVGLGAGRSRLVRQMLTESVLLSGAGTLAGVALAYFFVSALVKIMASGRAFERIDVEVHTDLHLLLFTAGIALLTGLLFGLAPAWYAFQSAPAMGLRQTGRGGDTRGSRLLGKGLVAAQVALSILLATSAALFLSHVSRLRHFDLGFRSDHVLLVNLDPSRSGYRRDQLARSYQDLLPRLEAIPGVTSASITACTPLQGCGTGSRFLIAEGHAEDPSRRLRPAIYFVSPRYFETLGIPLLAGRDFRLRDPAQTHGVVISSAVARHYFPGENPIGRRLKVVYDPRPLPFGGDEPYEVIGLVGDVKTFDVHEGPFAEMYFDMFQENHIFHQFQLRTSVDPASLIGAVGQVVRDRLKTVRVMRTTTLAEQVDSNIVPERLIATLSGFFGALGAALAGIGLYGLLAYSVARRTNEIGVRMALGAAAGDVARLVLRDALVMVGAGVLTGALLVLWGKPLAAGVVEGFQPQVAWPLLLGGLGILAVAAAAAYLPARRAATVDPWIALRHE